MILSEKEKVCLLSLLDHVRDEALVLNHGVQTATNKDAKAIIASNFAERLDMANTLRLVLAELGIMPLPWPLVIANRQQT